MADDWSSGFLILVQSEDSVTTQRQGPANPSSAFKRAPARFWSNVTDYLDSVSLMCLRYTSQYFRNIIKVDQGALDDCVRWLLNWRLQNDILGRPSTTPTEACCMCKFSSKQLALDRRHLRSFLGPTSNVDIGVHQIALSNMQEWINCV